jgi:hypothetical protein
MSQTFLTIEELADRWRTTPDTLEQWRKLRKDPPFHKIGRRVKYALADIVAYEDKVRVGAPQ